MSEANYEVRFKGEVTPESDREQVKVRMAALFKVDRARIDRLFSGQTVVIKRGLDPEAALKYRAVLQKIGAVAELVLSAAGNTPADPGAPPAPPPAADTAITIAEPGALLVEPSTRPPADIDTSSLSVAPVGGDLIEHVAVEEPAIDIADLSVAAVGSDLVDPAPKPQPDIDISELSAAPPGARLSEPRHQEPADIDISGLDSERH